MKVFAKSDIGKTRDMNQDFYFVSNASDDPQIFILADGMGGYTGGEVASNLAVFEVKKYIEDYFKKSDPAELIRNAIIQANKVIYEKAIHSEELEEMGTTLDMCLIYNNSVYIGHIGDSRVYKIANREVKRDQQGIGRGARPEWQIASKESNVVCTAGKHSRQTERFVQIAAAKNSALFSCWRSFGGLWLRLPCLSSHLLPR